MIALNESIIFASLGHILAAIIIYKVIDFIWIYFIKPSTIKKYSTPVDGKKAWALVTGASDGIGYEVVRDLLSRNFNVILHGRNPKKLAGKVETLRKEFPKQEFEIIVADASDAVASASKVAKEARELMQKVNGALRVLINNVGGSNMFQFRVFHYVAEAPEDLIPRITTLNVIFPHTLCRLLLPLLQESDAPSLIVNIGSMSGLTGLPFVATYSSSKAANHAFSAALANEMICAGANVEVIGLIVGDVVSAGNKWATVGWTTISSEQMAKDIIARVGCGVPALIGNWRHALQGEGLNCTPRFLAEWVKRQAMIQRRAQEDKDL
jgi:17beta-estradiol 17-dehydrogenase / very-long-chain 3-oxoacyl-CoA reductase